MKKLMLFLVAVGILVLIMAACSVVEDMPTVPMATITPTPVNGPSAMPTDAPDISTEMPSMPTETVMPDNSAQ